MSSYKERVQESVRKERALNILLSSSEKLPVIIERSVRSKLAPTNNCIFKLHRTVTVNQLQQMLRKILNIPADQSMFLLARSSIVSGNMCVKDLYAAFLDKDGFLYLNYCEISPFGGESSH